MLIPAQSRAAGLLARGVSAVQTARECGVSRSTLYRWKAAPGFEALYLARRQELDAAMAQEFQKLAAADRQQFIDNVRAAGAPPQLAPIVVAALAAKSGEAARVR